MAPSHQQARAATSGGADYKQRRRTSDDASWRDNIDAAGTSDGLVDSAFDFRKQYYSKEMHQPTWMDVRRQNRNSIGERISLSSSDDEDDVLPVQRGRSQSQGFTRTRSGETDEEAFRFQSTFDSGFVNSIASEGRRQGIIKKRLLLKRDEIFACFKPDISIYEYQERTEGVDTAFDRNLDILRFRAEVTEFRTGQPDIVLRSATPASSTRNSSGHEIKGGDLNINIPIVAMARFRWSRNVTMGLIPMELSSKSISPETTSTGFHPDIYSQAIWDEMKNTSSSFGHSRYQFSVPEDLLEPSPSSRGTYDSTFAWDVPGHTNNGRTEKRTARPQQRRNFMWRRTRSSDDGVASVYGRITWRNYRLIDLVTGEKVAVYLEGNGFKCLHTSGELRLLVEMSREFEIIVVLSCLAIWEKARRRIKWYSHGAT